MPRHSRSILVFILITQIAFVPVGDNLYAQSLSAATLIDQARKSYYEGNFDQAIALIKSCLQETKPENAELQEAYKILAQAYLAKNYTDAAREVVIKLLEINPLYSPTIEQEPPPFVSLVNEVKQQTGRQESAGPVNDSKWFWIGAGGALVIGAATLVLFRSGGAEPVADHKLADPPPMPGTQE